MEWTNNKPPDLKLAIDDTVVFKYQGQTYKYVVHGSYLNCAFQNNSVIFEVLGIDKKEYAKKSYGYTPGAGTWPEYHNDDYAAASRLVNELFRLIKEKESIYDIDRVKILLVNPLTTAEEKTSTPTTESSVSNSIKTNLNFKPNGKTIIVSDTTPSVTRGKETRGCTIRDETSPATVTIRSLSNRTVTGRI